LSAPRQFDISPLFVQLNNFRGDENNRPNLFEQRVTVAQSNGVSVIMRSAMRYDFLIETYATERIKVISAWSMFTDNDLAARPHPTDPRGRSVHEHMVHQCVSEDIWFRTMLDIDVGAPALPKEEVRLEFMRRYAHDSEGRLAALRDKEETWWEGETTFFDVLRSRTWVLTRRMTHTAHHRGQLLALLRVLGREEHSNYGPTADTGGLMQNHAPTIYVYPSLHALFEGEAAGGRKSALPGPGQKPVTERPTVKD
jgi:uncharacterized damage-inducible protein DinB